MLRVVYFAAIAVVFTIAINELHSLNYGQRSWLTQFRSAPCNYIDLPQCWRERRR